MEKISLGSNPHIPSHITFDILLRLPVKSLLRFMSVSKTWHAVINDHYFIEKHLIQSALSPNLINIRSFGTEKYYELQWDGTICKPFDVNFYPHLAGDSGSNFYKVVGISDGLVCLQHDGDDGLGVVIFNPSTRKFSRVPNNNPTAQLLFAAMGSGSGLTYSLMRVFRSTDEGNNVIIQAEMYEINTGYWREMNYLKITNIHDLEPHFCYPCNQTRPVLLNGVFYWEACFGCRSKIACLDTCNATYGEITIPESFGNLPTNTQNLIGLKGELYLVLYGNDFWAEFWVLNERERNWTKKFKVKCRPIIDDEPRIVESMGCHELIVRNSSWEKEFFSYNLETGETKALHDFKDVIKSYDYAFTHKASLISV